MSTLNAMRYVRGYITVRVEGFYIEKFLNFAVLTGINFWDIKRLSITEIEFKTNIKSYKQLKAILKKTKCRITIIDKEGLPFLTFRIKRRKMLLVGFLLFIFIIFYMSSFIWSVNVTGANTVSSIEIKKYLSELGIKPGAFKPSLSVTDIENNLLIKSSKLSWVKISIIGTRAEVKVVERYLPPEIVPKDVPCNIVAKKDGLITGIVSQKGDVIVKDGDPVKKGQVLVTGIIQRPNAETRLVHAAAEVEARSWYEGKCAIPLESINKIRNGNKQLKIYIYIGTKTIPVKNNNITYKNYDKIEKNIKFIDTDFFQLPIQLVLEEYHEKVNKKVQLRAEDAKQKAIDNAEKKIIDSIPSDAKIINRKVNVELRENVAFATVLIETIEDIGMQEIIEN